MPGVFYNRGKVESEIERERGGGVKQKGEEDDFFFLCSPFSRERRFSRNCPCEFRKLAAPYLLPRALAEFKLRESHAAIDFSRFSGCRLGAENGLTKADFLFFRAGSSALIILRSVCFDLTFLYRFRELLFWFSIFQVIYLCRVK